MTKRLNKTLLVVLSVLFVISSIMCLAFTSDRKGVKAEGEPSSQVIARNIQFNDTVYLLFAVKAENTDETPKMFLWKEGEDFNDYSKAEELVYDGKETLKLDGENIECFIYKYLDLMPKEMVDDVYVRSVLGYGTVNMVESELVKTSALDYCRKMINKYSTGDNLNDSSKQALKKVYEKLLNYGASIQKYKNYKLDRLATAEYSTVTLVGTTFSDGFDTALCVNGEEISAVLAANEVLLKTNGEEFTTPSGDVTLVKATAVTVADKAQLSRALQTNSKITLVSNIPEYLGVTTAKDVIINLDLNGYKIEVVEEDAITNNGSICLQNSNPGPGSYISSQADGNKAINGGNLKTVGLVQTVVNTNVDLKLKSDNSTLASDWGDSFKLDVSEFGDVELVSISGLSLTGDGKVSINDVKQWYGKKTLNCVVKTADEQNHNVTLNALFITKGIYTPDDLRSIGALDLLMIDPAKDANYRYGYYKLMNDIDFSSSEGNSGAYRASYDEDKQAISVWSLTEFGINNYIGESNKYFAGTFDGDGYAIKNMSMVDNRWVVGSGWAVCGGNEYYFFGQIHGGTVKDLAFTDLVLGEKSAISRINMSGNFTNVYVGIKLIASNNDYSNCHGTAVNNAGLFGVYNTGSWYVFNYTNVVIDYTAMFTKFNTITALNTTYGSIFGCISAGDRFNNVMILGIPSKFINNEDSMATYIAAKAKSGSISERYTLDELRDKGLYVEYSSDGTTKFNNGVSIGMTVSTWKRSFWDITGSYPKYLKVNG